MSFSKSSFFWNYGGGILISTHFSTVRTNKKKTLCQSDWKRIGRMCEHLWCMATKSKMWSLTFRPCRRVFYFGKCRPCFNLTRKKKWTRILYAASLWSNMGSEVCYSAHFNLIGVIFQLVLFFSPIELHWIKYPWDKFTIKLQVKNSNYALYLQNDNFAFSSCENVLNIRSVIDFELLTHSKQKSMDQK